MGDFFEESRSRTKSIAIIHDLLHRSGELSNVNLLESANMVGIDLLKAFDMEGHVDFSTTGTDVKLGIDQAIPTSLIINELIMNSLKHAFPDKREGHVEITVTEKGNGKIAITALDDGVGISNEIDCGHPSSVGLDLINGLVEQIDGSIELDRTSGTRFTIEFERK